MKPMPTIVGNKTEAHIPLFFTFFIMQFYVSFTIFVANMQKYLKKSL